MAQTATVTYQTAGASQITAQCEGVTSAAVPVTVTAPAGTPAQRILAYFTALPQQTTKRCIYGQFCARGGGSGEPGGFGAGQDAFIDFTAIQAATGKTPGIIGFSTMFFLTDLVANCKRAWNMGIVPALLWAPANPVTGGGSNDLTPAIHATVTPGTAAYATWTTKVLPAQAALLNSIKAAVPGIAMIYRPLHEENGAWFWWGNASAADYTALWKLTHDYMTNVASLGDTLMWDFNINAGQATTTKNYPGASMVDIVSFDWYGNNPAVSALSTYNALVALNKPIRWAEFGCNNSTSATPFTFDNIVELNAAKTTFAKIFSVSNWHGWWGLSQQNNAFAFMNDAAIASMTDVRANTR